MNGQSGRWNQPSVKLILQGALLVRGNKFDCGKHNINTQSKYPLYNTNPLMRIYCKRGHMNIKPRLQRSSRKSIESAKLERIRKAKKTI
jgi:hypothetical protein